MAVSIAAETGTRATTSLVEPELVEFAVVTSKGGGGEGGSGGTASDADALDGWKADRATACISEASLLFLITISSISCSCRPTGGVMLALTPRTRVEIRGVSGTLVDCAWPGVDSVGDLVLC